MDQIKIGKFIAEMRKQSGITQKELAEKIGISDKTISKWECGKSMPDLFYLESICDSLNVSVNELISGEFLSKEAYCDKAEENIMALMKENQQAKKGNVVSIVLGVLFILLAMFLTLASAEYGWMQMLLSYFDIPTFVLLTLLSVGMVLLSGKRKYDEVLFILQKVSVPNGVLITFVSIVIVMSHLDNPQNIGPSLAVCVISIIYSIIEYLVVFVLRQQIKIVNKNEQY